MLYIAYLDEFGHIGPYLAHDDPRHKTHPVFGLGGTFFFKLKNSLLDFEITRSGKHPARWEKIGSSPYTVTNIRKYPEPRRATFRLFNHLNRMGGFVFYVGIEKRKSVEIHDSKKLFHTVLRESIKRLDQECEQLNSKLLIIFDQQEDHVFRPEIVQMQQSKCLVELNPGKHYWSRQSRQKVIYIRQSNVRTGYVDWLAEFPIMK